jgi:hypothetical protein
VWTPDRVRRWAEKNLPPKFRSCHIGRAAEDDPMIGNWSSGEGIFQALRKFQLIAIVEGWDVPHAGRCTGGRKGLAYMLIPDRVPLDVIAERLREMNDADF